jgi:hypothetical protein
MMMRRLAVPVLLFLAAPACNGNVVIDNSSSAGGAGGVVAAVTTGVGGSVVASVTTGVGGAPSCAETHDTLSVTLSTWQGITYDCGNGTSDFELSAAVVESPGQGLLVLDSCSPGADCTPFLSKLSIAAPGISLDIPVGTYVKVHVAIDVGFNNECSQRVQITNLPTWDGMPNPMMPGELLWFLGVEAGQKAFPDSPIAATPEPFGCPSEQGGCSTHEDYQWHFQIPTSSSDPGVVVQMGATAYWGVNFPTGFEYLSVHNLRSFKSGACDAPTDLAYWIKHEYPLD